MALAQKDVEEICGYVKENLPEWLAEQSLGKPPRVYEIELRERIVRVEEELRHQRELMRQGFEAMDRRFEAMEKRFEAVDKRFEAVDKRFEAMDRRFDDLTKRIDRFMVWSVGIQFTAMGLVVAILKNWL